MNVRPYRDSDASAWDRFCADSHQATFLHTQRFLSYHGKRFRDASLIIEESGRWLGVFPAAAQPGNEDCVMSHPGVSYGGIVHAGALRGEHMIQALQAICVTYTTHGYSLLRYKPVPIMYHRVPAQDDLYALFRMNATRYRSDLTSTIDLAHRQPSSTRRKRCLNKAAKANVRIETGAHLLPEFWAVLTDNLHTRHGVQPVHNLEEITLLVHRFPSEIQCICGIVDGHVAAGILLFSTPSVDHAQYIAANATGHDTCALDAVLEHAIALSTRNGKRWFDFGNSNENNGMVLNSGLYQFKSEFGGGGLTQDFFELPLSTNQESKWR